MDRNINGYTIDDDIIIYISDIMHTIGGIEEKYQINTNYYKIKSIKNKDIYSQVFLQNFFADFNRNSSNLFIFKNHNDELITKLLNNLFVWFKHNSKNMHPILSRTIFLYSLIYIYPYNNKNIRLISNWYQLLLVNYNDYFSLLKFPYNMFSCKEFFDSINKSYKMNDINPFIKYVLNTINTSLQKISNNKDYFNIKDYKINKMLEIMESKKPMSAYEIMKKLNINSKETFRNSYLNIAIKKGLVKMTIPSKPTSRNQMYYKV